MFKLQITTLLVLLWQLQIVFLVCEPWTCRQTIYLKTQWTVECFRFIAWLYVAICAQNCKARTSKNLQSEILNIFEMYLAYGKKNFWFPVFLSDLYSMLSCSESCIFDFLIPHICHFFLQMENFWRIKFTPKYIVKYCVLLCITLYYTANIQ